MAKIKVKRMVALTFILAMIMGIAVSGLAVNEDNTYAQENMQIPTISSSPDYLAECSDGSKITKAYITTDSGLRELSKEEFAEILEIQRTQDTQLESETAEDINTPAAARNSEVGSTTSWYNETSYAASYHAYSLKRVITPYLRNETSNPAQRTITGSTSQSFTSSVSLTASDKDAIKLVYGASFSFTISRSYSDQITMTIPAGKQGWAEFYPIMERRMGKMTYAVITDTAPFYRVTSTKSVTMDIPILSPITNMLHGVVTLKEEPI